MRTRHAILLSGIAVTLLGLSAVASAQQMTIRTPFHTASDSFFEQNSISWAGNWKGISFSYGGGALNTPPFGSPQPNAGISANFGFASKDGYINFATSFGAGNSRSFTTQEPSVTIMNGQTGFISDTSQTPFVIGVVPVVGAFPVGPQAALPQVSADDLTGVDPRIGAVAQARADANAQAAAQAAAAAQAGGPVQPLPAQQRPNNMAPRRTSRRRLPIRRPRPIVATRPPRG